MSAISGGNNTVSLAVDIYRRGAEAQRKDYYGCYYAHFCGLCGRKNIFLSVSAVQIIF
jgi:hypothetical protein